MRNASAERSLNRSEAEFYSRVKDSHALEVHRNGWPDFLLLQRDGRPCGVEIKLSRYDRLSPSQTRMFAALERCGISVFVWTPDNSDKLIPWRKFVTIRFDAQLEERARKRRAKASSAKLQ